MLMKTALAAALVAASVNFAHAQGFDPNPANRGYPAYAEPNGPAYYNATPMGHAAAAASPGHQSRPAALQQHQGPRTGRHDSPSAAPHHHLPHG